MSCMCSFCERKIMASNICSISNKRFCISYGGSDDCDSCLHNYGDSSSKYNTPSCPQFRLKDDETPDWQESYDSDDGDGSFWGEEDED